MKRLLLFCFICVLAHNFFPQKTFAWGGVGHAIITKMADNHLTKKAKKNLNYYLDGHTIMYYASWMDYYRDSPEYHFTTTWHSATVNKNNKYDDSLRDSIKSDAINALETSIKLLENYKELSDSVVNVHLKYIIHLVTDIHCPSHVRYSYHSGKYNVKYKGKPYHVHHIWDGAVIDFLPWGITEWVQELDNLSTKEVKKIVAGTPRDWLYESAQRCCVQFDLLPKDAVVDKDFFLKALPIVEVQMQQAAYRLASVLNKIFNC